MKRKKKKLPSVKQVKRSCRDLCRAIVFARDKYACVKCGERDTSLLDWSHVIRRSRDARLSVDPLNSKVLCRSCHRAWHDYEVEAGVWFVRHYPGRWRYLEAKKLEHRGLGTILTSWWRQRERELAEELDRVTAGQVLVFTEPDEFDEAGV